MAFYPPSVNMAKASTGGGGGDFEQVRDILVPTEGQTVFPLTEEPNAGIVDMYVNGALYTLGVDYTVSGSTVTWVNVTALGPDDTVVMSYIVSAGIPVGGSVYYPIGW